MINRFSLVVFCIFVLHAQAYADTVSQTFFASCMPTSGQFSLRFDDVWNPSSLESSAIERRNGKPLVCEIEGVRLVAKYKGFSSVGRGQCDATPGGQLSLTMNGENFLKDALVNFCFDSIMSVDVFFQSAKDGEVKVCSRSKEGEAWECTYKPFSIPLSLPIK
ncbi:hypothetical protein [Sideroxydans lithotrophicus]|uniref:Uncharacterized protein n=1 Tax=Sideroxydans lithotrophicus (strain ES-1) TaxID=580332 RepID=D5CM09_SIDLE|nr:hypothetical protein [Sideroxydans lithotrophicus]ADE10623.1 hypothetical protein Slit_0382 [Sideroxydans lithotrophicus ES-1]